LGSDSDVILQLFVRKIILAQQVDVLPGNHRAVGHRIEKHLPPRGMRGLLARSCRNRNGANERDSSTKGSTKSLGMLAQTWGRLFSRTREDMLPEQTSAGRILRWDWRLEANLNRKANGLALSEIVEKNRSIRPRPLAIPGVENTSRIFKSAATCSRCCEVKSLPLSV
jgi:hypothetical protein